MQQQRTTSPAPARRDYLRYLTLAELLALPSPREEHGARPAQRATPRAH